MGHTTQPEGGAASGPPTHEMVTLRSSLTRNDCLTVLTRTSASRQLADDANVQLSSKLSARCSYKILARGFYTPSDAKVSMDFVPADLRVVGIANHFCEYGSFL
jgi:hypothetical protein